MDKEEEMNRTQLYIMIVFVLMVVVLSFLAWLFLTYAN